MRRSSGLHRRGPRAGPLLLVGLGGVGMMGLAIALRACFRTRRSSPTSMPRKREAALAAGARGGLRSGRPPAPARRSWRRPAAACSRPCDFVGSDKSLTFATGALAKGGKVVVTGLFGGTFTMPVAMFALKAMTIEGTHDRHARTRHAK